MEKDRNLFGCHVEELECNVSSECYYSTYDKEYVIVFHIKPLSVVFSKAFLKRLTTRCFNYLCKNVKDSMSARCFIRQQKELDFDGLC